MKEQRVSVIAIEHPSFDNLFLHGKRQDTKKWTLPGGSTEQGETPIESAVRELFEETGIEIKESDLSFCCTRIYEQSNKKMVVTLFSCCCPEDLDLTNANDPDREMIEYKFIDPYQCKDMHIPNEDNVLISYLDDENE